MAPIIKRTSDLIRFNEIREENPSLKIVDNVLYAPHNGGIDWGIVGIDNNIIEACAERWLPNLIRLRQSGVGRVKYEDVNFDLTENYEYIYAGRFDYHFGHFLIETVSRLWFLAEGRIQPHQRLVMHGDGNPQDWLNKEYVRDIFGTLGITADTIVHSPRPFRIKRMTVPEPSYRPEGFAHRVFKRLYLTIGDRLLSGRSKPIVSQNSCYYSKRALSSGVIRINDEHIFDEIMTAFGVDVISPESMSFVDQLEFASVQKRIGGWCTSAHHAGLFLRECADFKLMVPEELNHNFIIIDEINKRQSEYWFTDQVHRQRTQTGDPFYTEMFVKDPKRLAEVFAKALLE